MSPVNPVPQDLSRPMGVGRKGRAALPKAAEVCKVINPPSVPTTPTWRSPADAAPGQQPEPVTTVHTVVTQADVLEGLLCKGLPPPGVRSTLASRQRMQDCSALKV